MVREIRITLRAWIGGIGDGDSDSTERGQVTFRKEVLEHLGIRRGDKIELKLLPGGRAALEAARPTGSIKDLFGFLEGKTTKVATIKEINEGIAEGWTSRFRRFSEGEKGSSDENE